MSDAQYKWLIVGEGNFDVGTYTTLLKNFGVPKSDFQVMNAGSRDNVFRMNRWIESPASKGRVVSQLTLRIVQANPSFQGVILVVDSDQNRNIEQNYAEYSDDCRSSWITYDTWQPPQLIPNTSIILLDRLKGTDGRKLPIYGLCVPTSGQGCLETDLIQAYGYPIEAEDYDTFADTIKEASKIWCEYMSEDKKPWWDQERNGKARIDKVMYQALLGGFDVRFLNLKQIREPQIITDIKNAMNLNS